MITIEIYPKTKKPSWVKKGVKVTCLGEAQEVFTVVEVDSRGSKAFLRNPRGFGHGWESFKKLSKA